MTDLKHLIQPKAAIWRADDGWLYNTVLCGEQVRAELFKGPLLSTRGRDLSVLRNHGYCLPCVYKYEALGLAGKASA